MRTWRLASQHSHAIPCVCIDRHSIQRALALAGRGSDNTLTFNNTMKKNCVSHSCTSHNLLGNTQTPRIVAVTSLIASCLDATASVSISFIIKTHTLLTLHYFDSTLQQWTPAAAPQSFRVGLDLLASSLQVALLLCPGAVYAGSPGVQGVHQIQQLHRHINGKIWIYIFVNRFFLSTL